MNNEPVGKRDVANVLSKYLKSVPNDNVFRASAKQLYIWRGDFITDMTYKIFRLEKGAKKTQNNPPHILMSGGCIGITIRTYFVLL